MIYNYLMLHAEGLEAMQLAAEAATMATALSMMVAFRCPRLCRMASNLGSTNMAFHHRHLSLLMRTIGVLPSVSVVQLSCTELHDHAT